MSRDHASDASNRSWLNRTVLGVGLASLLSDWSHEMATTLLPAFLAGMGAAAAWLGLIEGLSDGLSSFAKMASGFYTDKLPRRKPVAVAGYLATALGTASFGLASAPLHVLAARSVAWLGRGVRTPVRKALLAGSVTRDTYGRAFGFERMMDTLGAIAGPATAFFLLRALGGRYRPLFAATLVPGLLAAAVIAFLVKERTRKPVPHVSFGASLRSFPSAYRRFLAAVGLFGLGAFARTLLILLATRRLTPELGPSRAAAAGVALYLLYNICNAAFAWVGGWLGDHFPKKLLLAAGYLLSAAMSLAIIFLPSSFGALALVFVLGGTSAALGETMEDSLCAEFAGDEHHGMAFGTLAAVNGVGDCLSSVLVGALWTACGTSAAFGYSAALSLAGALLVLRLPRTAVPSPAV